ncbi:MAG: hypothetical protein WCX65_16380 [bacterium]
MDIHKIFQIAAQVALLLYVAFWLYHAIECLRRKDFKLFDKIFWFILLIVPVVGPIMYRGIGNEFYKESGQPGAELAKAATAAKPKRRVPRGGVKIELPRNMEPPTDKN